MKDSLDQLLAMRVFARVVESGTFTKAANSLQMPNATVTKLVQGLETRLGVKLLQRTTRRVTVTPDGAAYYERTIRLLNELADMDGSLANAHGAARGKLRVDVGGSIARLILIPALPTFHARYPEIQLDLGVTDRPVDLIGDSVDCVIRGGRLTDEGLIARRVAELEFVTCATPAYLEKHGVPSHPRELDSGHDVASYFSTSTGRRLPLVFILGKERVEIEGKYVVAVNESNAHLAAGLAGLGVIQTFAFMARAHITSGELVEILPKWKADRQPLYVVYPSSRHLSARLRVFIDWASGIFRSHCL